jgi:hypothetical protein
MENQIQKNNNYLNQWLTYKVNLEYSIIQINTIDLLLDGFKLDILSNEGIDDNSLILLQLRISSNKYLINRNISTLETIYKYNFSSVYDIFKEFLILRFDEYLDMFENPELYIYYKIIPNSKLKKDNKIINKNLIEIPIPPRSKHIVRSDQKGKDKNSDIIYGDFNLPNTMDITQWGDFFINNEYSEAKVFKKNSKAIYNINIYEKTLKVKYEINNKVLFTFEDTIENKDLNSFTRKIDLKNKEILVKYNDTNIGLKSYLHKELQNIEPVKVDDFFKFKCITMDLETRVLDGIMSVYCCSIYDGKNLTSYYLTDYNNEEQLLITALKSLLLRKYIGYNVYMHNFSNFDCIFLLKILTELFENIKIEPIINNNDFINLNVKFSKKYNIRFRDSYLLLPSSLKKLATNFKVESKGIFPYKFVNDKSIPLDYIGKVPSYEYFDEISIDEYNNYCEQFKNINDWSLKEESVKYCNRDVKVLYKVLYEFALNIFKLSRINIIKHPTLSSLSLVIYRSNYLEKNYNIKKINGKIYDFIKKGYLGGAVDVYINSNKSGKKIFRYDVNSLYPNVMSHFDMPVGNPRYFEGDIFLIDKDPFGFFEVEVESPKYLKHPLLPYKSGKFYNYRTIAPLGRWKGVYFSEEIKNCKKWGYKFKIIRGYTFQKMNIFKRFVEDFYTLKSNSDKNEVIYNISKLILNSPYGKFGMSPYKLKHSIIADSELISYLERFDINSVSDLKNGKLLISYKDKLDNEENFKFNQTSNVNVAIAAAITAYGRIHMSQFKNSKLFNLYYSDTDCIDIDANLEAFFVGTELGKMKLEEIFQKVVYLSPKCYGGINTKNQEIIKIKGSKKKIKFNELYKLLNKNEMINIKQEKWYKLINDRAILVKNEYYTLMVTNNKRNLIYEDNILISTEPILINEIY